MLVFWFSLCIAEGWTLGSLEEQVVYIFAYLPKDLVVGKSIGARRRARKTNGVELERRSLPFFSVHSHMPTSKKDTIKP